jgi:hypothetical protein
MEIWAALCAEIVPTGASKKIRQARFATFDVIDSFPLD